MEDVKVLNPVAQTISLNFKPAQRAKEVKNLTLGLAWNGKSGGNIALRRIAENIKRELGYELNIIEFQDDFPFAVSTIEKVASSCQAVIGSTGD